MYKHFIFILIKKKYQQRISSSSKTHTKKNSIRPNFHTGNLFYGEISVRQTVQTAKFPTAKFPYAKISLRRNFFTPKFLHVETSNGEISHGEISHGEISYGEISVHGSVRYGLGWKWGKGAGVRCWWIWVVVKGCCMKLKNEKTYCLI